MGTTNERKITGIKNRNNNFIKAKTKNKNITTNNEKKLHRFLKNNIFAGFNIFFN